MAAQVRRVHSKPPAVQDSCSLIHGFNSRSRSCIEPFTAAADDLAPALRRRGCRGRALFVGLLRGIGLHVERLDGSGDQGCVMRDGAIEVIRQRRSHRCRRGRCQHPNWLPFLAFRIAVPASSSRRSRRGERRWCAARAWMPRSRSVQLGTFRRSSTRATTRYVETRRSASQCDRRRSGPQACAISGLPPSRTAVEMAAGSSTFRRGTFRAERMHQPSAMRRSLRCTELPAFWRQRNIAASCPRSKLARGTERGRPVSTPPA